MRSFSAASLKSSYVKIALVGNPNSGKSTLFNVLTGLNQKTGNFPGVTVEKRTGTCRLASANGKNFTAHIIDLPGSYSLHPKSLDEKIVHEMLTNRESEDFPDVVVYVADSTNLKRSLFLATQLIELRIPFVLALNMSDEVGKRGLEINTTLLAEKLGAKVVCISARRGTGIEELRSALSGEIPVSEKTFSEKTYADSSQQTIERYRVITSILNACVTVPASEKNRLTERLDRVFTHKLWGYAVFLVILFLIFQAIFVIAKFPMQWIESSFVWLSAWGNDHLPKGELSNLLVNGVLAGLSGIVVFVPQIALLFFFIAVLEDTGYMARVSFIMDKLMRRFGMNGKSVIPLISGVACAVPAILTTRTISNWKERMITIMVTPLMSCSARLPVFTLLIALIVPAGKKLGFLNLQGLVLMGLYLLGFAAALGSAWLMKLLIRAKEKSYFIMELPVYRSPRWRSVGLTIADKVKVFLLDAGKVIIAISVILWFLSSHAPGDRFEQIEKRHAPAEHGAVAAEKLQASYAGMLGRSLEPAIAPLGFDWKIGISLITSFAAREVFVGTMATIYSVGSSDNTQSIREKMLAETNPQTGDKVYSLAVGVSLMIFYAFALQCMSTVAVVYRETRTWKWPLIQFVYMGALAYLGSFAAFHLLK